MKSAISQIKNIHSHFIICGTIQEEMDFTTLFGEEGSITTAIDGLFGETGSISTLQANLTNMLGSNGALGIDQMP